MHFQVNNDGRTIRTYDLDEEEIYLHFLGPNFAGSWLDLKPAYGMSFYPRHPYNNFLWNEYFEAMQFLKTHLIEMDLLRESILLRVFPLSWSKDPFHPDWWIREGEMQTFKDLNALEIPGFVSWSKEVEVKIYNSFHDSFLVKFAMAWHTLDNMEVAVQELKRFCFPWAPSDKDNLKAGTDTSRIRTLQPTTAQERTDRSNAYFNNFQLKPEKEPTRMIPTPGYYRHYKGGLYRVITRAHSSDTQQEVVVFESLKDSSVWFRPIGEWCKFVSRDGLEVPRFERLESIMEHHIKGAQDGK